MASIRGVRPRARKVAGKYGAFGGFRDPVGPQERHFFYRFLEDSSDPGSIKRRLLLVSAIRGANLAQSRPLEASELEFRNREKSSEMGGSCCCSLLPLLPAGGGVVSGLF